MRSLRDYYCNHKKQLVLIGVLILLISITCLSFFQIEKRLDSNSDKEIVASLVEKKVDDTPKQEEVVEVVKELIKVDVKGYVMNEGVYSLDDNARVIDAINAAGGLKEGAYTRFLNLSKRIHDEDIIIVNNFDEVEQMKKVDDSPICCEVNNKACVTEDKIVTSIVEDNNKVPIVEDKLGANDNYGELNTLVNINTASKDLLMSLNGIGESKADKIIEYRTTNGNFKTIDDIKNVSGIGDSVYDKIKEFITVK